MVASNDEIQTAIDQARAAVDAIHKVSQRSYWKQGDPASKSSDTQDQIFHAVGAALSAWESAESALATLYVVLCDAGGASSIRAITRTFGCVMSSGTRRDIVRSAAETFFGSHWQNPLIQKPLTAFLDAFGDASRRRDDFAHGQAYGFAVDGKSQGYFLFPSQYVSSRNHASMVADSGDPFSYHAGKYRYTAREILDFAGRFCELQLTTIQYAASMRRVGGTPGVVLAVALDSDGATSGSRHRKGEISRSGEILGVRSHDSCQNNREGGTQDG